MKRIVLLLLLVHPTLCGAGQGDRWLQLPDSLPRPPEAPARNPQLRAFVQTAALLDAALTSLNSLQSLVHKDSYRNRIGALNNPASTEMGFSLEAEIQVALRPILAKARSTNTEKFGEVITSFLSNGSRLDAGKVLPLFPALAGLVGNLAVREKSVTRADVDSFLQQVGRYFAPYEKLQATNDAFEDGADRFQHRLQELQFDIREYALDMATLLHAKSTRSALRERTIEELLLQYFEAGALEALDTARSLPPYPPDGLTGAKNICNTVQKLFRDYQKLYADNYNQIRGILQGARPLGRAGNPQSIDAALKELEELYQQSAQADVLNLRIQTLTGRLQALVQSVLAAAAPR
ncbi:hypothetical protein EPD60_06715 [Flaviaesturariibacter flavus]|uniref:Uncharacterized protein n=1 Tax=Flaviaesturariibacter flavus TaxID=2502780 RepID=A0A4V2NWM6_9BACT|nr:hypothetical protein [Flaviaesturariibacter flavus]TCJ17872.1 hypothetical protein EPD60_06715 [Flaviaesturariibacter flavus]